MSSFTVENVPEVVAINQVQLNSSETTSKVVNTSGFAVSNSFTNQVVNEDIVSPLPSVQTKVVINVEVENAVNNANL